MVKHAEREVASGSTYKKSNYEVVEVKKNFEIVPYDEATSDYDNVVVPSGSSFEVTITAGEEAIKIAVDISGLENCSMYSGELKKANFDLTTTSEQTCTWNGNDYLVTLTGTLDTSSKIKATDRSAGGLTFGSGTFPFTRLEIKLPASKVVNAIFVKAASGIKGGSYDLTIKVGDTEVFTDTITDNSGSKDPYVTGIDLVNPIEGVASIVIESSTNTTLILHSVGFDVVS